MSSATALSTREELLRLFAEAPDAARRAHLIEQHWSDLSPEFAIQLADVARERVRVNTQEALSLAEAAINVAQVLGDERSLAYAIRNKANALYAMGQYRDSIELHKRAIAAWEKLGEAAELGRSLSVSILP